jgi:beta-N-acetylhexosaminidase
MTKRGFNILLLALFLAGILAQSMPVKAVSSPQAADAESKAIALLEKMTPEEKVGQLFLVSFQGSQLDESSSIFDLITNHHVGGVILNSRNDNFSDQNTVASAQAVIKSLQQSEWDDSQSLFTDQSALTFTQNNYVPLLISINQDGDSYPYDQIINGVTPLPNEMAIGATWNRDYAQRIGNVLGQELSAIGFNLYLGPSLDVLDLPYVEGGDDLGTRTFGGDPYWVGEMGQAMITGIHQGSNNQMAVIAKHFPGRGSSDRLPEEEVATVRKSLEQLKQIELAPFFSVTGNATEKAATADGLLVSHIRYQGFQGNIRTTTRPVSFDQAAQEQLMSLPEFAGWRDEGGIIVSDNLGSNAVRKFFDPTGESYDPRQIAREAFLSGNDLLLLDLYIDARDIDPYATTLRILEFFTQKYLEDAAFAQRVDNSVKRILWLKYELYPEFTIENVLPDEDDLALVGTNSNASFEIANQSAVLMSPDKQELSVVVPRAPQSTERIVFITERVSTSQCSTCPTQDILAVDSFQKAVLRLYGPDAGEQVVATRMSSFTFTDIYRYLNDPSSYPTIDSELRNASWIIFTFIKPDPENPESLALKMFLSERTDLLRDKKIIAFGLNAPYYLDATDISKLTAYYVLFSKTPAFVDMAARILFQEASPEGTLPVSVSGIGYDLITAMSPEPTQVIPLYFGTPNISSPTQEPLFPQSTVLPIYELGQMVEVSAGVVYDYNHNPVPDGTVVKFIVSYQKDVNSTQQVEATTMDGIAMTSIRIQNTGIVEIRASSEPALLSQVLQMEVPAPLGAEATIVVLNTPQPTETPTPTASPTTGLPTETSDDLTSSSASFPSVLDWFVMLLAVSLVSALFFWYARAKFPIRWVVRSLLFGIMGGNIAYIIVLTQINSKGEMVADFRLVDVLALSVIGTIAGWFVTWLWYNRTSGKSLKELFANRK